MGSGTSDFNIFIISRKDIKPFVVLCTFMKLFGEASEKSDDTLHGLKVH